MCDVGLFVFGGSIFGMKKMDGGVLMEWMLKWVDVILMLLILLLLVFVIFVVVILVIGESLVEVLKVMVEGVLFFSYGWGFMLYYIMNFIFIGLVVMVVYYVGLFNIGGEG